MSYQMSQTSQREVLKKLKERYAGRGRLGRSRLLDEACALSGLSRKHVIKVMSGRLPIGGKAKRRGGPRRRYGEAERKALKMIWMECEQACGKRLKAAVPLWLPHYERRYGALEDGVRARLLEMSAATMDRLLAPCRVSMGSRGRCGTRPGTLLRKEIPIRTEHWDVEGPGWLEADTVAHCGESMAGDFCWSVTLTDVHTQWTEVRAIWNKGQYAVCQRIAEVERALPFAIKGFDTDNGGEFLNWHLADYFRLRKSVVPFTRSRPYHKNDNAHVEQKNWTHVRQLVGYGRLGEPAQADRLNDLYLSAWNHFRNFFCPVMKHLRTEVEGSRKKRIYDRPATPFERLKACEGIDPAEIEKLEALLATLDPFDLKRTIERKLRRTLAAGKQGNRQAAA